MLCCFSFILFVWSERQQIDHHRSPSIEMFISRSRFGTMHCWNTYWIAMMRELETRFEFIFNEWNLRRFHFRQFLFRLVPIFYLLFHVSSFPVCCFLSLFLLLLLLLFPLSLFLNSDKSVALWMIKITRSWDNRSAQKSCNGSQFMTLTIHLTWPCLVYRNLIRFDALR